MQGRDRDVPLVDRSQIGSRLRIRKDSLEADPEIGPATCIDALIETEHGLIPRTLRGHRNALHFRWRQRGEVDVEEDVIGPADLDETLDERGAVLFRAGPD